MTSVDLATQPPDEQQAWSGLRRRIDLVITPTFFASLTIALALVWIYSEFDSSTADILEASKLVRQFRQHITITFWSTVLVVSLAVPLGIVITRPRYRRFAPPVLAFANSGQAIPAYGLIVLFFAWLGQGMTTAVIALTVFAILPVLRNTMVGLDQVDQAAIEAGRGMGMSKRQALLRIELPLAVPVILAGIRTALVINVGMAALAFLIGAGGLGITINSGLKLQRNTAIFVGASLVALLALAVDFVAALAERYLRPKGI